MEGQLPATAREANGREILQPVWCLDLVALGDEDWGPHLGALTRARGFSIWIGREAIERLALGGGQDRAQLGDVRRCDGQGVAGRDRLGCARRTSSTAGQRQRREAQCDAGAYPG